MFTRNVIFTGAKDIDSGIAFVRDTVTPVLHSQHGWRGTTVSADRPSGVIAILTLWETEAACDASESALLKVRDEGHKLIGGHMEVEYYEQVHVQIATPPTEGAKLLITFLTMDPAKIDENLTYFTREVAPTITSAPGFLALRQLVNRKTGAALLGTTWINADARDVALASAEKRRASTPMPVTITGRSERDIVYIDLPS